MAQIKLFKFDTDGYQVEHDPTTDDISVLSLTVGTGGISVNGPLDMLDNQIVSVPTPTDPDHGVNKAYVDAVAQGLDVHEGVIAKTTDGLGTQITLAGSGGTGTMPTSSSFDFRLDGEASWTTITWNNPADMAACAAFINSEYGATVAFVNGNNIDLKSLIYGKNSQVETQNVQTETTTRIGIQNDQDVSGVGFTAAGAGVGKTLTAPTSSSSYNTIDTSYLSVGDRVLVSCEAGYDTVADVDNGLYEVTALGDDGSTALELTRTTDCDVASSTEFHNGTYVFVTAGTAYENTGWTCVTDVVTVDTTANKWTQFSGAPGLTFDQGLVKVAASVQVELDTAADAATSGAAGGSSGLEFDVDTASGKIRVRVSPTGGIDRLADGIGLDLDGTTLQLDAGGAGSGVSVKGLPSLFEINGNAVSANVTAANVDTLVAGVSSDADALHTHDGKSNTGHTHTHASTTSQGTDDHHAQSHAHNGVDGSGTVAHSDTTGQGTDDHHAQAHALDGGDHTVTGLTAGDVLTALTSTTFGFATPVSDHTEFDATAGTGGVTKGDPVYISANGIVLPCSNTNNNTRKYCGVALETKAQTETVRVQQDGKLVDVTVGGSPVGGDYVYLGSTGLTVTLPTGSGTHRMVIGKIFDASGTPDVVIEPQYLGKIG